MTLTGILVFLLKNWKYIVFSVAAFGAGITIAWKIQDIKVSRLHNQIDALRAELKACDEAVKSNLTTIENLKNEIKRADSLCKRRLKSKESVIENIRKIDELGEKKDEKGDTVDTLLDALRGMFP